MTTDTFSEVVFVEDAPFGVRSVGSVMDAIEFLEEWPVERRGGLHMDASEICCAAYDGRCPVEVARKAFASWARRIGIYACAPPSAPLLEDGDNTRIVKFS